MSEKSLVILWDVEIVRWSRATRTMRCRRWKAYGISGFRLFKGLVRFELAKHTIEKDLLIKVKP